MKDGGTENLTGEFSKQKYIEEIENAFEKGVFRGDLCLRGTDYETLPAGFVVEGDLDLRGSNVKWCPENLTVTGNMNATHCPLELIADNTNIGGSLSWISDQTAQLGHNVHVGDRCLLSGEGFTSLPAGLETESLNISGTTIDELPGDLKVNDELNIRGLPINHLPESLRSANYILVTDSGAYMRADEAFDIVNTPENLQRHVSKIPPIGGHQP